ncbi:MAG: hypothetical protein M3248_04605 [Actinomycetota bacterium]|nr:hypothetical protein [Actinomycetota bacterium]
MKGGSVIAEQKATQGFYYLGTPPGTIEQRNTEMMFGFYTDDATLSRIERNAPNSPREATGKEVNADLGI